MDKKQLKNIIKEEYQNVKSFMEYKYGFTPELGKVISNPYAKSFVNEVQEPEVISQLRDIVNKKQNKKIKDPKSGKMMRVDMFSASAIVKVYDAVNKSNKEKFSKLSLPKMVNVAFTVMKKESVNEAMDMKKRLKVYDKLKKGDKVTIKYGSSMRGGVEKEFVVSKGKTKVGKAQVERIILKNPANPKGVKYYLYNRDGNVSMAIGDMAATIEDMHESVNEAKLSTIHKAAKKGSYPVTIVATMLGKVVKQEIVLTPMEVPAAFNMMQGGYPRATIAVEDRHGKVLFKEGFVKESVNEGKHDKTLDKLADLVKGAKSFMDIGKELKKAKIKDYHFSTSMLPMYVINIGGAKVAILNKKYADGAERVVGTTAIGLMESLNEGKFYITRNLGRGQGKALVGGYDLKRDKKLPPKVFKSYKDAQKEVEKLQRGGSMGGQMTAYIITDKDMNMLKPNGKKMFESVNEGMFKVIDQIRQDSKDAKDFIKNVFSDSDFKDMRKDKEFLKYLKSIYEGFSVVEEYDVENEQDIKEFVNFMKEYKADINEAEYQGRDVKLGKIMQGDVKKFKVYVKNPKGNVVKVNFGHKGKGNEKTMSIKKNNPERRKAFRARHNCDNPGPRHKARYWSCKKW